MNRNFRILSVSNKAEWKDVLYRIGAYDFYHLPEYHGLHEKRGEGLGRLVIYEEGDKLVALPLLIREVSTIPGLEEFGDYRDATSVYGYPGPLANVHGRADEEFLGQFAQLLDSYARSQNWVSVFSRLHPLLANHQLLTEIGSVFGLSDTIAIDLTIPPDEQIVRYRKSHRYEIRRARREGIEVIIDTNWEFYASFVEMYLDTMRRVGASTHYFFDQSYFDGLRRALENHLHLFVARMGGQLCAASLFVLTADIVQYHLSASNEDCLKWAPSKLIIDESRKWAISNNARWLHLGGGVGSSEDALFRFKAGFSPERYRFHIWKWIVNPDLYEQMTRQRQHWLTAQDIPIPQSNYFPAYRIDTL